MISTETLSCVKPRLWMYHVLAVTNSSFFHRKPHTFPISDIIDQIGNASDLSTYICYRFFFFAFFVSPYFICHLYISIEILGNFFFKHTLNISILSKYGI